MKGIKERPECRKEIIKIIRESGAETFGEIYWKLNDMHWESLFDYDKPKDKRKYSSDMRKQLELMYNHYHFLYVRVEDMIQYHRPFRICSSCGKKHLVGVSDYRKELYGDPVEFLCSVCR